MKQQYNLKENIKHNDLAELVNTTFSVDQYKSKLGEDENIIVIAFVVMDYRSCTRTKSVFRNWT